MSRSVVPDLGRKTRGIIMGLCWDCMTEWIDFWWVSYDRTEPKPIDQKTSCERMRRMSRKPPDEEKYYVR